MSLGRRLWLLSAIGALSVAAGVVALIGTLHPDHGSGTAVADGALIVVVFAAGVSAAMAWCARNRAIVERRELADVRAALSQSLARLGELLVSTHDFEGIVDAVVETALLVVPADTAVFYRVVEGGALEVANVRHAPGPAGQPGPTLGPWLPELTRVEGGGMVGAAAARRALVVFGPDSTRGGAASVGSLDPAEPDAGSGIAVPVVAGGRLVGVLAVYVCRGPEDFSDEEVGLLHALGRQFEVAVANIELHETARREALTDGVTGLWNRRHFDLRVRDAVAQGHRFEEPFSVALFDLDNFKRINDTWDHFTGDAALVHFAAILRKETREVDVVSRWGGEEFAVLLQRVRPDEAQRIVSRILDVVRTTPLDHDGDAIWFTTSAGLSNFPVDGTTGPSIVAAADAALLRAKAGGKDRVEQASSASAAPDTF